MIQQGSKVKVTGQPGIEKQYPAFFKGFVGKIGEVVSTRIPSTKWCEPVPHIQIKIDTENIWLRRDWVTQVH